DRAAAKGEDGSVEALRLAAPTLPAALALGGGREVIEVADHADEAWRMVRERILLEQRQHRRGAVQEAVAEVDRPRRVAPVAERSKPHLPIDPGHVRRHELRPSRRVAGL